jgi:putative sterol carrier protein
MTDAASEFFERLRGEHLALPTRATGVMRVEIVDGKRTESWLVAVDKGEVEVSRRKGKADSVLRGDRALFNGMAAGEVNAFAATLRGEVAIEGDPRLLVLFQRLLPAPPSRGRRRRARGGSRSR